MKTLQSEYINVNGSLLDLSSPCVMGILNVTLGRGVAAVMPEVR